MSLYNNTWTEIKLQDEVHCLEAKVRYLEYKNKILEQKLRALLTDLAASTEIMKTPLASTKTILDQIDWNKQVMQEAYQLLYKEKK